MITLNTEKGLVTIENWEDILARPDFVQNLNPKQHKLKEIIGLYSFPDKVGCGLSNCHAPHNRGFIVSTESGATTNIGNVCGKREFGEDFEVRSRTFKAQVSASDRREALGFFLIKSDELAQAIKRMRTEERGADWIHPKLAWLRSPSKGCPKVICDRLSQMVRSRSSVLSISRRATEDEIEQLEVAQSRQLPRPQYVDEAVAEIAGLPALFVENDLRELLVIQLSDRLRAFLENDIDTMTDHELREWSNWISSVDATIDRATSAIGAGRELLVNENLRPLERILSGAADRTAFKGFLRALPHA